MSGRKMPPNEAFSLSASVFEVLASKHLIKLKISSGETQLFLGILWVACLPTTFVPLVGPVTLPQTPWIC